MSNGLLNMLVFITFIFITVITHFNGKFRRMSVTAQRESTARVRAGVFHIVSVLFVTIAIALISWLAWGTV